MDPTANGVNIEAWTESTIGALEGLQVTSPTPAILSTSPRNVRGTAVALDIPLDAETPSRRDAAAIEGPYDASRQEYARRREPLRRDSMKRREALLKGKEGSRRRQKWENDRLLGNPWVEPPSPQDWEIRPTYPVRHIPYYLAPLWDEREAQRKQQQARQERARVSGPEVPRSLREKMKRSKGAKTLLQDLEEQVRSFVASDQAKKMAGESAIEDDDDFKLESDSEEEIVFVGRNGAMQDMQAPKSPRRSQEKRPRDKLVFDSPANDSGGNFGRWLVHTIAMYYDLNAWSVTTGNPARREAYVSIDTTQGPSSLPRPLWGLV